MEGVRLVTFDAGNTLIRAHPSLGEIYSRVTAEHGAILSADRFVEAVRPVFHKYLATRIEASDESDRKMWRTITRELYDSLPELAGVTFDDWFEGLYAAFGSSEAWRFFEEVEETLCEMRYIGFKLGLISNWDSRLRRIAGEIGLLRYMHAVAISSEVGYRKPHTKMFEKISRDLDHPPHEACHVGDLLEEDVEGALKAGWRAVLIDRTGTHPPPADGRYTVIRKLSDLVDMIPDPHDHK